MKREGKNATKKHLFRGVLSVVLSLSMIFGSVSGESTVMIVHAEPALEKTVTGLGIGAISDPVVPESKDSAWSGSYVYYGTYNGEPVKYRVLDSATDRFGGNTMFLDCDTALFELNFRQEYGENDVPNRWPESDIRARLNTDEDSLLNTEFTLDERAAIAESTVGEHEIDENLGKPMRASFPTYTALDKDKLFLLDFEDILNEKYGYYPDCGYDEFFNVYSVENHDKGGDTYWLRSPSSYDKVFAGVVGSGGTVGDVCFEPNVLYWAYGCTPKVSPAFNINRSSVIFSSLISGNAGEAGAEYKLTIKSDYLEFTPGAVTRDGETITVPYTVTDCYDTDYYTYYDADMVAPDQISVVITDGTWTENGWSDGASLLQYGKLMVTDEDIEQNNVTGMGSFTLDTNKVNGTWGTDYHVYILAEYTGDTKKTDYASVPVEIKVSKASGDTATVKQVWASTYQDEEGRRQIDPDTLEFSEKAVEGKELAAKFITDGSYTYQDGDDDLVLILDNVSMTMTGTWWTAMPEDWKLSGNSQVSFGNLVYQTTTESSKAFDGDSTSCQDVLSFYSVYPYEDDGENHKVRQNYDVTVSADYDVSRNILLANTLTIPENVTLTLKSFYFDGDDELSGSMFNGTNLILNGTLKTEAFEKGDQPPVIGFFDGGSCVVSETGSIIAANNTELIFGPGVTCTGIDLYQRDEENDGAIVPYELTADHGRETFVYSEEDGKWIHAYSGFYGPVLEDGIFKVEYDDWSYAPDQEASIEVNGKKVGSNEPVAFEAGQEFTVTLNPPAMRQGCEPVLEMEVANGPFFSSRSQEEENRIILNDNTYTFTTITNQGIWLHVWWSDFDRMECDQNKEFTVDTNCHDGSILLSADAKATMSEPNNDNHIRRIMEKSVFNDGNTLKFTFQPAEGKVLNRVEIEIGNQRNGYVLSDPQDGEYLINEENGFTCVDGVYSYTLKQAPESNRMNVYAGYQDPVVIDVITYGDATVQYRLDDSTQTYFSEDGWIEYPAFADAESITLIFTPVNDSINMKGISVEWDNNGHQRNDFPMAENYEFTLHKGEGGWISYKVCLITWDSPLNNQFLLRREGDGELTFSDNMTENGIYQFDPEDGIDFTVTGPVYKLIVRPNTWEEFEIPVTNGAVHYDTPNHIGLTFEFYTSKEVYDFHVNGPKPGEKSANLFVDTDPQVEEFGGEVTYDVEPIRVATYKNQRSLILSDERNDQNEAIVKTVNLTIAPKQNWTYRISVGNQDVTEAVMNNQNVYAWDVSDPQTVKEVRVRFDLIRYEVEIQDGFANTGVAFTGQTVDIGASQAPEGKVFDHWEVLSGGVTLADANAENTSFVMGTAKVQIRVVWADEVQNLHLNVEVKHTCSVQNNLSLNYKVKIKTEGDFQNVRLVIERQVFEGTGTEYSWDKVTLTDYTIDENGRYCFYYRNLAAKEMGSIVKATVVAEKGTDSYMSDVDNYSIKQYAEAVLTTYGSNTDERSRLLCTFIVDMLNYGSAAQLYFGYNTSGLANGDLSDEMKAWASEIDTNYTSCLGENPLEGATAQISSRSLVLGNSVELKTYLTFGSTVPGDDVSVTYSYTSLSGSLVSVTVNKADFVYESNKNRYAAKMSGIVAKDFSQPISIVITKNGVPISGTYTFSYETYAGAMVGNTSGVVSEKLKNLLNYMMAYSRSAKIYFK